MTLLSIDTCDARGSVALLRKGNLLEMVPHDSSEEYSSWLLPTVSRLLQANSLTMAEVEAYAVAVGPGSFTGVRVGLTTVKAWGEVYRREIAPVSRLGAVASQRMETDNFVAAFLDASRGQIFGALYEYRDNRAQLVGQERAMDPESFLEFAEQNAGGKKVHWLSSDPEKMEETARWRASKDTREPIQRVSPYLAETIGVIGYKRVLEQQTVSALNLDANYVRRPDAEVFWRHGGSQDVMSSAKSEKQIKVRRMAPGDVDKVVEITRESPGAAQWRRGMYSNVKDPAEKAWVAEYENRLTGFLVVRVATSEAEILNLAVDQRMRRKGIARKLLREALRELGDDALRNVFLEVRESNAGARAFYGELGFETYGKRPGYYHDPDEAAVCMKKKLSGQDQVPT